MAVWLPVFLVFVPAAIADPDEAVSAGREALSRRWRYPWYDSDTDGIRHVDVQEEVPDPAPERSSGAVALGSILQWLGWTGIALLLALAVWLLLVAWRAGSGTPDRNRGAAAPGAADRVEALPMTTAKTKQSFLEDARRLYEQGDFSRAVVFLFAHQLLELDRGHIIRLARGKTNRQYLREVGRREELRRLVEQTMVAFEDVFFGNRPIDRARFEACWAQLPKFELLARGATV